MISVFFPIGKICVKGTNVFSGYYKDYQTYIENMDEDGWFHTGDVGQFTMVICLYVIDWIHKFY